MADNRRVTVCGPSSLSENRVNVGVRYHWYGFVKSHAGKG